MVKIKGKPSITLIIIALLLLLLGSWHTVRMMAVKYWMEDYLKKEYGKEFVVNKVGYIFSYYGDGLRIKGIAHPKDDPDLKFDIIRDAGGGVFREHLMYRELYIRDLWERQKREEIESILKNKIVWANINAYYKEEELYGRTISVKEAERQFKNRMELYITCGLLIDFKEFSKKKDKFSDFIKGNPNHEQAKSVYDIIKKIKNPNYKITNLEIRYFNSKYEKRIKANPKWYLYGTVLDFEDLPPSEKDTLLCSFIFNDINHINKPEDVNRFVNLKEWYLYHDK